MRGTRETSELTKNTFSRLGISPQTIKLIIIQLDLDIKLNLYPPNF